MLPGSPKHQLFSTQLLHFSETSPAILTINKQKPGHHQTPALINAMSLPDHGFRLSSWIQENGFVVGLIGFFAASPRNRFTRP
jgi:hypothetical protein